MTATLIPRTEALTHGMDMPTHTRPGPSAAAVKSSQADEAEACAVFAGFDLEQELATCRNALGRLRGTLAGALAEIDARLARLDALELTMTVDDDPRG